MCDERFYIKSVILLKLCVHIEKVGKREIVTCTNVYQDGGQPRAHKNAKGNEAF